MKGAESFVVFAAPDGSRRCVLSLLRSWLQLGMNRSARCKPMRRMHPFARSLSKRAPLASSDIFFASGRGSHAAKTTPSKVFLVEKVAARRAAGGP